MSHMVIFQTPDGNPGYNQFEVLDEAVSFVESLRNEQGVETARIFALEEVKFAFKSYFRVEVDPPMLGAGESTTTASSIPAPEPVSESAGTPQPAAFESAPAYQPPPSYEPTPAYEAPSGFESPAGYDQPPVAAPDSSPVGSFTPGQASPYGSTDQSPVGNDAPTFMAPPPPAAPDNNAEPTRRGLFGR